MKVVINARAPKKFGDLSNGNCFYFVENGKPCYFMKVKRGCCMETNAISLEDFGCRHFFDDAKIYYCDSTLTLYREE